MNDLTILSDLGIPLPTPAYIAGAIIFGIIGILAYRSGKKQRISSIKWIGVALMLYPYVVSDTRLLYGIGVALCIAWYCLTKVK